ncbi:hypothetical protein BGZ94_008210 [Podila epigama]|nr:hypothetical protein BGZ94_008210 [Podila epigama]
MSKTEHSGTKRPALSNPGQPTKRSPVVPIPITSSRLAPRAATSLSTTAIARGPLIQPRTRTAAAAVPEVVPVNDLVQSARKAFSQKDFASALQLLTQALNMAPTNINLLDSRAACFEKLGRLQDGLADAKAMIQHHPKHPKALARHAKEMTEVMEQQAKREARILDPIERLPYELVVMVFESLTFAERCLCQIVSTKWFKYLGSIKRLWYAIEFAKPPTISASFQTFLPPVISAATNNRITNKTVLALVKNTPPKALHLGCAPQITGSLLEQLIRMRRAASLEYLSLRMNPKIFDQELSRFWTATPKLRSLDLHDSAGVSDAAVRSLLARCPLLEELDISECRVTEACVMSRGIDGAPSTPPLVHMKKLTFGRSSMSFSGECIDALVAMFPNLETLDIRTLHPRGFGALEGICRLGKLRHLYTDAIDTPSDNTTELVVAKWVEGIPNLESLQLTYCKGVSDAVTRLIVQGHASNEPQAGETNVRRGWSHSLRMLNLSYSTYLTNEGLLTMAAHPVPHLHSIILNCCGWLDESGLCQMLAACGAELRLFECARNGTISNTLMEQLATSCPNIEYVNVSTSQVTGVGVMALVNKRGSGLLHLKLDGCQNISADAIERARMVLGDGSRISFLFPRTYR